MTDRRLDGNRMRFSEGVAAAIRAARHAAGLTQRALAEQASLSHSMVVSIEDCRAMPSLWAIAQIAEALDTTIDELAPVIINVKEEA